MQCLEFMSTHDTQHIVRKQYYYLQFQSDKEEI